MSFVGKKLNLIVYFFKYSFGSNSCHLINIGIFLSCHCRITFSNYRFNQDKKDYMPTNTLNFIPRIQRSKLVIVVTMSSVVEIFHLDIGIYCMSITAQGHKYLIT